MNTQSITVLLGIFSICVSVDVARPVCAQESSTLKTGKLEFVSAITRDDLLSVVPVNISQDGKFLYASAFAAKAITVFERNSNSGELTHIQTIDDPGILTGVTGLRLSADGQYAVSAAFGSGCVTIFRRDPQSGKLEKLSVVRKSDPGVSGLAFAIRADFSPDGNYVYAADGETGGLTTFEFAKSGPLKWLETNLGQGGSLAGTRGLAISGNGKSILTANYIAGTVVLMDRNAATGKTTVRQVLRNGEDGVSGLAGVFGVAYSPDDGFAYTTSGRFEGDNSVCGFQFGKDGRASVTQKFINNESELRGFEGGNGIVVSPEGRNVYATATVSGAIACFTRDAANGKLQYLETIADDTKHGPLGGANGLAISPDGKFLYVAAESKKSISIYRRVGVK